MPLKKLKTIFLTTNFNLLVRFMNYSKWSFESFVVESKKSLSDQDAKVLDATVDGVYDRLFWNNGLLMLCSLFEEELYNISSSVKSLQIGEKRFGLDRHKEIIKSASWASELFAGENWSIISDGFKLRHCILHANGRIDRTYNIDDRLRNPKFFTVNSCRMHLNPVFVGLVQDSMHNFLESVIGAQPDDQ